MKLNSSSAVIQSSSIDIDASPQKVWAVMSNIENWPSWNKDIKFAKLNGELTEGTTFTWKAGPGTITSTLEKVNEYKLIGWSGKLPGIRATHIWRIEPRSGYTTVTTEESWDGLFPRLLKNTSKKILIKAIETGLVQLKAAAEHSNR